MVNLAKTLGKKIEVNVMKTRIGKFICQTGLIALAVSSGNIGSAEAKAFTEEKLVDGATTSLSTPHISSEPVAIGQFMSSYYPEGPMPGGPYPGGPMPGGPYPGGPMPGGPMPVPVPVPVPILPPPIFF